MKRPQRLAGATAGQNALNVVHYRQGSTTLANYAWTYGGAASGSYSTVAVMPDENLGGAPAGPTLPFHDPSQIDLGLLGRSLSSGGLLIGVTSADGTVQYGYDPLGQLTGATYTGSQPDESFTWDANGNPSGTGYVVGAGNRLLSDGTYRYSYDAEGNRTARWTDVNQDGLLDSGDINITQYTWDNRNRLVKATDRAIFGGDPTQIIDYLYDVENRWIGENTDTDGNGTIDHQTRFAYEGNQIALQFDKSGADDVTGADLSHRYLWGPAVDQVLADEQVTDPQTPGNVVWPLADNLGTVRDLAVHDVQTGDTTVANHRVYDSFGNLKSQTNAAIDCVFGFTGLPFDKASETYRTPTRPYDPATGQWLQPDWIGFEGGDTNLYRYCGNSPTNATDPQGLEPAPRPSSGNPVEDGALKELDRKRKEGQERVKRGLGELKDALKKNREADEQWLQQWRQRQNKINADTLRKNMEAKGIRFQKGEQAHHIVQSGDKRANDARNLLREFRIDINAAENGAKLTRAAHQGQGLQTNPAIKEVTETLRRAAGDVQNLKPNSKAWHTAQRRVIQALKVLKGKIERGEFYRKYAESSI